MESIILGIFYLNCCLENYYVMQHIADYTSVMKKGISMLLDKCKNMYFIKFDVGRLIHFQGVY